MVVSASILLAWAMIERPKLPASTGAKHGLFRRSRDRPRQFYARQLVKHAACKLRQWQANPPRLLKQPVSTARLGVAPIIGWMSAAPNSADGLAIPWRCPCWESDDARCWESAGLGAATTTRRTA
jgi:hypothetical protein